MTATNLNQIELNEFQAQGEPTQRCKATFPLFGAHGTQSSATVYFEVEPGERLGRHTDSAEELLYIIDGTAEVTVGKENLTATRGGLVLVPKMVPHDVMNVGTDTLLVLGFFGGAKDIVATFDRKWDPVDANVVDTSVMY